MDSKVVKADFGKLNDFVRDLMSNSDKYVVRIGIMGKKNARNDGTTNAEIGFVHEFGTSKIPKRSFLRMPIFQKSDRIMKEVAHDLKVKGMMSMVEMLTDVGIACERAVLDAFDTGGWGYWQRNAASTKRRKGSSQPLIDTGQLRRSITSAVVKR